ncbi:hypothetical protein LTS08_005454 [Lithohypha guttulata]|uniref:Glutathione S-transferase n=1 Tax=Lithohypha guttulata TaxID=1690604 RepID=A0AAN7T1H3_9EURO|nr:hypothetical protein LTR51_003367 [Lithohypha guttulata]KAK5087191.1 hypothetical protein LTR05_004362 [Lithohypha guttulata]KAK5099739.1 hypothetical protein LTS08_005454 [Lithohypha guttulata]
MSEASETYDLIYWPGLPGRGEFIRLVLEQAGANYTDTAHVEDGMRIVLSYSSTDNHGSPVNPPPFAPPMLKHGKHTISQTPNILLYLGPRLGLAPSTEDDPIGIYHVNALTLTALDGLSNEPHDTHHPIAVGDYYEDQKGEALKRAKNYREQRLPKFLEYFQRVLSSETSRGGEYLYGGQLTYADLVLFQTIDGVSFAFPKRMSSLKESGKYDKVFALHERVKALDKIAAYLKSGKRQKYLMGIYRHYPELDDE